jgi:hypothetical protein
MSPGTAMTMISIGSEFKIFFTHAAEKDWFNI